MKLEILKSVLNVTLSWRKGKGSLANKIKVMREEEEEEERHEIEVEVVEEEEEEGNQLGSGGSGSGSVGSSMKSSVPVVKATTTTMINRDECCPTLLKIVVLKNGKKLEWKRDWKESLKKGVENDEKSQSMLLDLYAWPDSSLEEIALLVASKVPDGFIANHNVKFVFKAIHMEKFLASASPDGDRDKHVVKPSISEIGFLYLNNQHHTSNIKGGHPKTLFKSRFSLGDILEVSILTRAEALGESNNAAQYSNTSSANAGGKMKSDLRSSLQSKANRDRFAPYLRK